MSRNLFEVLADEKSNKIKGGVYHKLQVDFAYNSNHIEGSRLTHDQTRYIYETQMVGGDQPVRVDDIFEAVNHFRCFDHVLDTLNEPVDPPYIKELHRILKSGTLSSNSSEAVVGGFKKYPNFIGDMQTAAPEEVGKLIDKLTEDYNRKDKITLYDILDFHAAYEKIHPFYDGNGRTGRLLMFKECLKNDIVPFLIEDTQKMFYYRGLKEWQSGGDKAYFADTCLAMQDRMKALLEHFRIEYDRTELRCEDVLRRK